MKVAVTSFYIKNIKKLRLRTQTDLHDFPSILKNILLCFYILFKFVTLSIFICCCTIVTYFRIWQEIFIFYAKFWRIESHFTESRTLMYYTNFRFMVFFSQFTVFVLVNSITWPLHVEYNGKFQLIYFIPLG